MEYLNRIWVFNYTAVLLGLSSQYVQVSNIIPVDADDIYIFFVSWIKRKHLSKEHSRQPCFIL